MEFLRFGSSIPGSTWGCCAIDIIQNFSVSPDYPASIQIVSGDGGNPLGDKFLGLTHRDVFLQRLRIGTHYDTDMPDHAFIATITSSQVRTDAGKKWLELFKEQGFEFIRAVGNSVYNSTEVAESPPISWKESGGVKIVYIFALFRNISKDAINPYSPPDFWDSLPDPYEGACYFETQVRLWENLPPKEFYTEEQVEEAGVPVTYAGLRSNFPQQVSTARALAEKGELNKAKALVEKASKSESNPFGRDKPVKAPA